MTRCFQLFQRAIAQSGTALSPWAFQPDPRTQAEGYARRLGITWTSTQNMVDQLRNVPMQAAIDAQGGWLDLEVPRGFTSMEFVPCVEPVGAPEYRFLTADPVTLMRSGNFLQMPAMMGFVDVSFKVFSFHQKFNQKTLFSKG